MAITTASIAASPKSRDFLWLVKSTALPPGSACGQRWVTSPFAVSSCVSGSGCPPEALTRTRPLAGLGAITIVPSSDQLAPRLRSTLQSDCAVPPVAGILRSSEGVTKPTQAPSWEKNGW